MSSKVICAIGRALVFLGNPISSLERRVIELFDCRLMRCLAFAFRYICVRPWLMQVCNEQWLRANQSWCWQFIPERVMLFNEFWRIGINKWPSVIATPDMHRAAFFFYLYTGTHIWICFGVIEREVLFSKSAVCDCWVRFQQQHVSRNTLDAGQIHFICCVDIDAR